ncbi:MAG: hypothetical protein ACXVRK_15995 [Gaiellaceae bacterium]
MGGGSITRNSTDARRAGVGDPPRYWSIAVVWIQGVVELMDTEISRLFRAVNEEIVKLGTSRFGPDDLDLVCECPDSRCMAVMRMRIEEYEATCAEPDLIAVVPGHEGRGLEDVVEQTDRYVIVRVATAALALPQAAA